MQKLVTDVEILLPWAKDQGMRVDRLVNPIPVGLVNDDDGKIRVVVIFDNFNGVNVYMHVLSDGSKRWMTKSFLHFCFDYAFNVLHASRVTGLVDADNEAALNFDRHLGFEVEGIMERASGHGLDIYVLRMFKEDCRFI